MHLILCDETVCWAVLQPDLCGFFGGMTLVIAADVFRDTSAGVF